MPTGPGSEKFYEAVAQLKASKEAQARRRAGREVNMVATREASGTQELISLVILKVSQNLDL